MLRRKKIRRKERYIVYEAAASDCGTCLLKPRCTQAQKRGVSQHLYEGALNRMQERVRPAAVRLRRWTAGHPFATIKYRIFGHPRLLMRGLSGAGRNWAGNDGIQHQTHVERARRNQTPKITCIRMGNRHLHQSQTSLPLFSPVSIQHA
jgi:hypothetical protein